ncbi:DUF2057 domain-containing protein [Psychrobacter sanguinis]|nr:DUF2057 domain-containing protein [Psychrobacter sanguinis]MCC3307942.1 DUF2057 domain-containing protein [Psychrobacter sanguinis]MCC3344292.1 DUF2057 domain-containing protein [Psychrobacter sanguinis]UEC25236.1 DUF2057 domain-containing protein [Psychrobacter sanguinis]
MTDRSNKPMFNKLLTLAGIGLFSLTFAHAEVTLSVDDNIKVTAINGQQMNSSPFQSLKKSFNLQPGKHVITAKYDRLYDLRNDEHDYLRSGNVTVTAEMQDNQTYRLAMPGQPEKYEEAKQYAKAPTLAVMKGSQVVSKSTGVIEEGGLFSSITSLFGSNDAQMENQKAIAAINADGKSSNSNAIAPVSTNSNSAQADTLDRFMQLWLQATPDEREKIRQWIQK